METPNNAPVPISVFLDSDLPDNRRPISNFWRATAMTYYMELIKLTKGLKRVQRHNAALKQKLAELTEDNAILQRAMIAHLETLPLA